MEKEFIIIKMEILNMKEILLMIHLKEKVNIYMKITSIILVNGRMVQNMEKVLFIIRMEIFNMKVILLMMNMMDMENILKKMEIII